MGRKTRTAKAGNKLSSHSAAAARAKATRSDKLLALLRRANGATIKELSAATGWQEHSVRGFISGTLKKRRGLNVISQKKDQAARRYRLAGGAP